MTDRHTATHVPVAAWIASQPVIAGAWLLAANPGFSPEAIAARQAVAVCSHQRRPASVHATGSGRWPGGGGVNAGGDNRDDIELLPRTPSETRAAALARALATTR